MRIIVFGATGATGKLTVDELLRRGHAVSAFSRRDRKWDGVNVIVGDVLNPDDVTHAVAGHDAVVVTLGITENPLLVRLRGAANTATDVRSQGTKHIVDAMQEHGVKRLVVQSSYGVGPSRGRESAFFKFFFWAVLAPQIQDTELQEQFVIDSDLDWVLAQPVGLNDNASGELVMSTQSDTRSMKVPRRLVAEFLATAAASNRWSHQHVALSV